MAVCPPESDGSKTHLLVDDTLPAPRGPISAADLLLVADEIRNDALRADC